MTARDAAGRDLAGPDAGSEPGAGPAPGPAERSAAGVPVPERVGRALFVYGTLMFGDIVEVLLYRRPVLTPAVAAGWRVARLPGRVYPGLVPASGRQAEGMLLPGLTAAEWAMLDDFEGDDYVVRAIGVETRGADDPGPANEDPWVGDDGPVAAAGRAAGRDSAGQGRPAGGRGAVGDGDPAGVTSVAAVASAVALTYAWRAVDSVEEGDWDPDWFRTRWLGRYAADLGLGLDVV